MTTLSKVIADNDKPAFQKLTENLERQLGVSIGADSISWYLRTSRPLNEIVDTVSTALLAIQPANPIIKLFSKILQLGIEDHKILDIAPISIDSEEGNRSEQLPRSDRLPDLNYGLPTPPDSGDRQPYRLGSKNYIHMAQKQRMDDPVTGSTSLQEAIARTQQDASPHSFVKTMTNLKQSTGRFR